MDTAYDPEQAQLRQTRQRLQHVLHALEAGFWEWDVATDAVVLDERWAQIVGHQLSDFADLKGHAFIYLCHPEDHAESVRRTYDCLEGRTDHYACEMRMRHKDGHWVWVLDSGSVTERDAQGRPLKMIGARQDISARKEAQTELHRESERFIALAQVSNTGVWEWDQQRQYLWCSKEYFSMLGRDPQDYSTDGSPNLENTWLRLLHPDDLEAAKTRFARYLQAGAPGMYQSEFRMQHADGSWVWIWSRGSALRDAAGRASHIVMGTHINISALKEAQQRLYESRQQLQRISNNLPDAMVYQLDCGMDGSSRRMTYVSTGVERLHGLSVAQVLDDARLLYDQVQEPDRQRLQAREQACIAELREFRVEFRLRLPDGRQRWRLMVSSPHRGPDGHVRFDGIEIDITERKDQEQLIQQLNSELEQRVQERTAELSAALQELQQAQQELLQREKLAALGALVAGVAHELNTPIGNAVTVASTLGQTHKNFIALTQTGLTRSALAQYQQDMSEGGQIIERNLERAAQLIGSFKQLAVDQTSSQRRRFALRELCQEVALAMRPALRKTPITLEQQIAPELVLDSYPGPLGQVLMNLINNALLHAFAGRAEGRITLSAQPTEPGWLQLCVADDGMGIAPDNQKKVFDPFFTTKLGQGGSGLGLHICYTLVTGLLGGSITLESQPGQGSCLTLHLPLQAPLAPGGG